MVNSEKLCLQWNEFQKIVSSAFGELRDDLDLTDVTLACEDGEQVEAHKIVLASCSPFFMDLFKRNKHPHPLIYMRGIKGEVLASMVEFMYKGEANVDQENLENFLGLAEELRLKGLDGRGKGEDQNVHNVPAPPKETVKKALSFRQVVPLINTSTSNQLKTKPETTNDWTLALNTSSTNEDLDSQIRSMMEKSENNAASVQGKEHPQKGKARICKVCGKEGQMGDIQKHIEAKHITGVAHNCTVCGSTKTTRDALRFHMYNKHRN